MSTGGLETAIRRIELTDDERRTVAHALDAGYYEQPRTTTHTDIAAALDSDPMSVAKTLRRVERHALSTLLD